MGSESLGFGSSGARGGRLQTRIGIPEKIFWDERGLIEQSEGAGGLESGGTKAFSRDLRAVFDR